MNGFLFAALLLSVVAFYMAMAADESRTVEAACMLLIGVALLAFLAWFVLCGPTPSYLPEYGTGTQPMEMRD
ncbi:hypothetical protein [Bifidobacterium sp.]|uniref:hypothetical protein n=1 Tax=Bifidobacterium sp. TaxID=41200 RepID=UPI00386A2BDB